MGIRPHDKLPRLHKIFQHDLMTHAFALIKRDIILFRKLPHLFMRRGSLRILCRDIVVYDKDQLILIRDPRIF